MPGTVTRTPAKRVLAETSNTRANVLASPRSAKKLKIDNGNGRSGPPTKSVNGSFNSSQPGPSQFEETLEKMTQEMEKLKESNTEKDQQWRRPLLPYDFNEISQNLIFQQIEAEEGILSGGKTAVKLFGVTEVNLRNENLSATLNCHTARSFRSSPCDGLHALLLRCRSHQLPTGRLRPIQDFSRE